MRSVHVTSAFILACMLILQACAKEEYVYPNVVTAFVDGITDNEGILSKLITDKEETFDIQFREGLDGLKKDTTYRIVSVYQPLEGNTVFLYSTRLTISEVPKPANSFAEGIMKDPADIRSIWQSGYYLNMILTPMVKDKDHIFHFVEYGIDERKEGSKILHLGLFHNRKNDEQAFNQEVYLSVPLQKYIGTLQKGDSIFFHINTYKEGETVRKFTFPAFNLQN